MACARISDSRRSTECSADCYRPLTLIPFVLAGAATLIAAVAIDTSFYSNEPLTLHTLLHSPVITPWNNLRYNSSTANLRLHGLHPHYQHVIANLPQLLGPVYAALMLLPPPLSPLLLSAMLGVVLLSLVPHQEARFLLPAVPLLLASVRLPRRYRRSCAIAWVVFNVLMAVLMGVFHQAGIVPAQLQVARIAATTSGTALQGHVHAFWWKTYQPPTWLLDGHGNNVTTTVLMGMKGEEMVGVVSKAAPCLSRDEKTRSNATLLVAPSSATFLQSLRAEDSRVRLEQLWNCSRHVNLDDLDIDGDGVWPTLSRVFGQRGLVIWRVERDC